MAMLIAISGTLIGAVLGIRFIALVLVPATLCAVAIAGGIWLVSGGALGLTIAELALFVTCLQIGYLCGAALRLSLVLTRGSRSGPAASEPSLGPHSSARAGAT